MGVRGKRGCTTLTDLQLLYLLDKIPHVSGMEFGCILSAAGLARHLPSKMGRTTRGRDAFNIVS